MIKLDDKKKAYIKDFIERVISSFFEAFLGVLLANEELTVTGMDWKHAVDVAVYATIITLIKCYCAKHIGDNHSASLVK